MYMFGNTTDGDRVVVVVSGLMMFLCINSGVDG